MKKMHLQQLTLTAIVLFMMVSCSKDDGPAPVANLPKVPIGTQIWQSTNLDVSTYRDGTPIPQVTDPTAWANLTTGAWCYVDVEGSIYGKFYNWYAVAGIHDNDPKTPNKVLAPTGWHVASDAEWTTLIDYLGGETVAGGKMKDNTTWGAPNTGATNSSGFTGSACGWRTYYDGRFYGASNEGHWWSSSEANTANAFETCLLFNSCYAINIYSPKNQGNTVRCVKD